MDVSPCVLGLKAELGAVDGVVLSGAPSLKVQVSLSGWICAMLFLFNHELGYDEAYAKKRNGLVSCGVVMAFHSLSCQSLFSRAAARYTMQWLGVIWRGVAWFGMVVAFRSLAYNAVACFLCDMA